MNGERPYHEPMRLLTIIEAPREMDRQADRAVRSAAALLSQ